LLDSLLQEIYYSGCAFNFGLKDVAFNAMGSVDNTEEVQYLYRFQNSNHFKRLKDFSLQNCMAPAKIEIRTQDGFQASVPRDPLLLYSPLLRDLVNGLPCQGHLSAPLLILPDVKSVAVISLIKILLSGEADDIRNKSEGDYVCEVSKLLNIGIETLDLIELSLSTQAEDKSKIVEPQLNFPKPILIETNSTIMKMETESLNGNQEEELNIINNGINENLKDVVEEALIEYTNGPADEVEVNDVVLISEGSGSPQLSTSLKTRLHHCRLCPEKSYLTVNNLLCHYIYTHFSAEIETFIKHRVCKLCGFNGRKIEIHVGIEHQKIKEILQFRNLWNADWKPKGSKKTTSKYLKSSKDVKSNNEGLHDENLVDEPGIQMASSDVNCNFDAKCEVCGDQSNSFYHLEQHMVSKHFQKELEVRVRHLISDKENSCKICGDDYRYKSHLLLHLGCKHGFINDVLKENRLAVIPCTVKSSGYSDAKQEKLIRIKEDKEGASNSNEDWAV